MPARPKFETCAKIDLSLLIENGVINEDRIEAHGFESGDVPMVLIYVPPMPYPRAEPYLDVEFEKDGYIFVQKIGMGFTNTKQGQVPYLVCPVSGARCKELYLHRFKFISRREHPELNDKKAPPAHRREVALMRKRDRVLGTVGRLAVKGEERSKLIAELQAVPLLQLRWPQLGPHFEAEDRRRQRQRKAASRPSTRYSINSTEYALRRGKRSTGDIDVAGHAATPPEQWVSMIAKPDELGDLPLGFVEDYPVLDIRALTKDWSFDATQLWSAIIVWPQAGGFLIADLRDPDRPLLRMTEMQRRDGSPLPDQIIRMGRAPRNGRWYLQCPMTGRLCELLFRRKEIFVSAQAARLIHRSQRAR